MRIIKCRTLGGDFAFLFLQCKVVHNNSLVLWLMAETVLTGCDGCGGSCCCQLYASDVVLTVIFTKNDDRDSLVFWQKTGYSLTFGYIGNVSS